MSLRASANGTSFLPAHHFGVEGTPAHRAMLGADGRVHLPIAAYVVYTGGLKVLLDAGLGPRSVEWESEPGQAVRLDGGGLPGGLTALGLAPADIDVVLLSHLHADHSGWVWHDGKPFFPRATVRFGRGDWDTFVVQGTPGADGAGLRALAELGKVDLIDSDGPVAPGISSLHTPGHTPGHQTYVVSSGASRALFLGDAVSCPAQIEAPELEALADMDKVLGIRTRDRILQEIDGADFVGGPHFPDLRFGRVLAGEGHRLWNFSAGRVAELRGRLTPCRG